MELNIIYNGDCFEGVKSIPDGSIDLVITDPPYGIDLTPQRSTSKFKDTKVINDDSLEWLDGFVDDMYRICKNVCCVFCGWQKIDIFKQAFEKRFLIKNMLVWNKDWFGMGNNYRPNYELCLLCCKTDVKTRSNNKSNILTYRRVAPTKLLHSCEKPVALIRDLIEELTDVNALIFDPFMGSGTTAIACLETGRYYIGYELDPEYFKIAQNRILDYELNIDE